MTDSKKETLGPIRCKLVGPERCDVPGIGVVKPGDIVEFKSEIHAHGAPNYPKWWEIVKPTAKKKEDKSDG